jgi:hypothetical protein
MATRTEREMTDVQLAVTEPEALIDDEKAAEVADDGVYVPLRDEEFRLKPAEEVPLFALMQWSAAEDTTQSLAGLYRVLQSLIDPDEWSRFVTYNMTTVPRVTIEEMVNFQKAAFETLAANPTEQPEDSSAGSSATGATSTASTSAKRARVSKR